MVHASPLSTQLKTTANSLDQTISLAIRAHMAWRLHIQDDVARYLHPDIAKAGDQHACDLGHLIDDIQPEFGDTPEWQALSQVHVEFHQKARHLAILASEGREGEALDWIRAGAFTQLSFKLIASLLHLRDLLRARAYTPPLQMAA